MIWLEKYVQTVEKLLVNENAASLTYAALEVRLALERICYERLRIAHEYISPNDLRSWTPKYVVTTLLQLVDPKITSKVTLSMSTRPVEKSPLELINDSASENEEWVALGTQVSFDPALLAKHWQAMSSFLHTRLPKSKDDQISQYSETETMLRKISEALAFLKSVQIGTMIIVFSGETVSFQCVCGQKNVRPVLSIKPNSLISCVKENCVEKYRVERCGSEFEFERLKIDISCHNCQLEHWFPFHDVQHLDKNHLGKFKCNGCGVENNFTWKLMQVKKLRLDN